MGGYLNGKRRSEDGYWRDGQEGSPGGGGAMGADG